jgi:hypothetical protein
MLISLLSVAMLSAASPAAVASTDTSGADKKICKREKQIGSMVRTKKICRTKAEWDDAAEQARADMNEIQRTSRAPSNGG